MKEISPVHAYAAALTTVVVWAGSFPAISLGVRHVEPAALAAVRFALAGAVFAAWLVWRGSPLPERTDMLRVAASAFLGIALYNVLINVGHQTVSPGAASFIIATQTVFASGFSHLLGHQRIGAAAVLGMLISLAGVLIISIDTEPDSALELGTGAPLIFVAAICSGANFLVQRNLAVKYGGEERRLDASGRRPAAGPVATRGTAADRAFDRGDPRRLLSGHRLRRARIRLLDDRALGVGSGPSG